MTDVDVRRLVEPADCARAADLLVEVWKASEPLMSRDALRALSWSGGYVFGAWEGEELAGVCVGFLTPHGLHSHITGILPTVRRRGLGVRLKEHQRSWALERGIEEISWTCDPLIRRNMSFNLRRLGARVEDYLVDFYGPMDDGLNAGDASDRLHVVWPLTSAAVRCEEGPAPRPVLLEVGGEPLVVEQGGERRVLVATPPDIEALRQTHPDRARRWRGAVREALVPRLTAGWRVTGLTPTGDYVLEAP